MVVTTDGLIGGALTVVSQVVLVSPFPHLRTGNQTHITVNRLRLPRCMVAMPVPSNVQATAEPDALVGLDVVEKTRQGCGPSGTANETAV